MGKVFMVRRRGSGPLPPSQVQGLTASANGSGEIDLAWVPIAGVLYYTVRRFGVPVQSGSSANTYSDVGLQASTTYSYTVSATNSAGEGSQSAIATATTGPVIIKPTGGISWNPGPGLLSQDVMYPVGTATSGPAAGYVASYITGMPAQCTTWEQLVAWCAIETAQGVYDFSQLDTLYNLCASNGKRLVIEMVDRSFTDGTINRLPAYLATLTNGGGGWYQKPNGGVIANLWLAPVMDRLIALDAAIGAWGANKPFFEGYSTFESDTGFTTTPAGYTAAGYMAQLQRRLDAAANNFPTKNFWQQFNFIPTGQVAAPAFVDYIYQSRCGLSAPDVKAGSSNGPANMSWGERAAHGYVWNSGSASWVTGGKNYVGLMPIAGDIQSPDLGGNTGSPSAAQVWDQSHNYENHNHTWWNRKTGVSGTGQQLYYDNTAVPTSSDPPAGRWTPDIKTYISAGSASTFLTAPSAYTSVVTGEGAVAVLSAPTPTGTLASQNAVTIGATTTQVSGNFYAVVDTTANLAGITAAQIKAGRNKNSVAAVAAGTSAVSTTTPTASLTGLAAGTGYSYACVQNNSNGDSNIATGTFTTAAATTSSAVSVLYTDIISGTTVNGPNGLGIPLSIFGTGFGTTANMGTTSGARVFIGGVEVGAYLVLDTSVINAQRAGVPVIQRLIVQVGALAGLTQGTAYPISVVVNGVTSNTNDVKGNPIVFTPNPGDVYYVDGVNGNDSTGAKNDITKPFKNVQNANGGSTFTGIFASGNLKPGDYVLIRGNGGAPFTSQTGFEGRLMRWNKNAACKGGSAPNGTSGTGYISFMGYPGEDVYIQTPAGGLGGFMGANTSEGRGGSLGTTVGRYWTCSNMRTDCTGAPGSSDASNFNLQSAADFTRFVNLDVQWNSTSPEASHQKAGGIVGDGDTVKVFGCYVHNIAGGGTSLENHGIYGDSNSNNIPCTNWEIGYCVVLNCTTGQGIQFHSGYGAAFSNIDVHHFYIENTGKYGFKLDAPGGRIWVWNGIINRTDREGIQIDATNQTSSGAQVYENITLFDTYRSTAGAYLAQIANEGAAISGTCKFVNCVIVYPAGRTNTSNSFVVTGNGMTYSGNLYYDYNGTLTAKPSADTAGIYANPQFVNAAVFPNTNVSLPAGSAALNRAIAGTINPVNDFSLNPQPRAGNATRSVGAEA